MFGSGGVKVAGGVYARNAPIAGARYVVDQVVEATHDVAGATCAHDKTREALSHGRDFSTEQAIHQTNARSEGGVAVNQGATQIGVLLNYPSPAEKILFDLGEVGHRDAFENGVGDPRNAQSRGAQAQ